MSYENWLKAEDKESFVEEQKQKMLPSEFEIYVPGLQFTAGAKRAELYPSVEEQLGMIWHAVNSGISLENSEWFKMIKEIKEKFPKP